MKKYYLSKKKFSKNNSKILSKSNIISSNISGNDYIRLENIISGGGCWPWNRRIRPEDKYIIDQNGAYKWCKKHIKSFRNQGNRLILKVISIGDFVTYENGYNFMANYISHCFNFIILKLSIDDFIGNMTIFKDVFFSNNQFELGNHNLQYINCGGFNCVIIIKKYNGRKIGLRLLKYDRTSSISIEKQGYDRHLQLINKTNNINPIITEMQLFSVLYGYGKAYIMTDNAEPKFPKEPQYGFDILYGIVDIIGNNQLYENSDLDTYIQKEYLACYSTYSSQVNDFYALSIRLFTSIFTLYSINLGHHDLKPGNILLESGNIRKCQLSDFGTLDINPGNICTKKYCYNVKDINRDLVSLMVTLSDAINPKRKENLPNNRGLNLLLSLYNNLGYDYQYYKYLRAGDNGNGFIEKVLKSYQRWPPPDNMTLYDIGIDGPKSNQKLDFIYLVELWEPLISKINNIRINQYNEGTWWNIIPHTGLSENSYSLTY